MRRLAELIALTATAATLVATGAARSDCATETVTLQASTTCGAAGPVVLATRADCVVTATGGAEVGLPTNGYLVGTQADAGLRSGFLLEGYAGDGGLTTCATVARKSGAIAIQCGTHCWSRATADGGAEGDCASTCEGNLNP